MYRFVGGLDFQLLKDALKEITDILDHKVLVPVGPHNLLEVKTDDESETVNVFDPASKKFYVFPKEDTALVAVETTTAEDMAQWIASGLVHRLKIQHVEIEVRLDEGPRQSANVLGVPPSRCPVYR